MGGPRHDAVEERQRQSSVGKAIGIRPDRNNLNAAEP